MADTIKIGSLDISAFKVGSSDCKVYLGSTLLYPQSPTPPTPTYEWKQYNEGDTIPASLIYGVKLYLDLGADNEIDFQDTQQSGRGIAFVYVADADGWYGIDINTSSEIDLSSYYDSSEGCYIVLFSDLGYGGLPIIYPSEQFEFDVQLYEEHVPTLQWVTFNNGDTIPSDLDVYGVSGISQNLLNTYGSGGSYIQFNLSKRWVEYYIYNSDSSYCADGSESVTDPMEIIFSNKGCSEFINQGATVSGTIKLYIYA